MAALNTVSQSVIRIVCADSIAHQTQLQRNAATDYVRSCMHAGGVRAVAMCREFTPAKETQLPIDTATWTSHLTLGVIMVESIR